MEKNKCKYVEVGTLPCNTNKMTKNCNNSLVCDLHYDFFDCKNNIGTAHVLGGMSKEMKVVEELQDVFVLNLKKVLDDDIMLRIMPLPTDQFDKIYKLLGKRASELLGISDEIVEFQFATFVAVILATLNTPKNLHSIKNISGSHIRFSKQMNVDAINRMAKDENIKLDAKKIVSNFKLNIDELSKEMHNVVDNYLNKNDFIHKKVDNSIN